MGEICQSELRFVPWLHASARRLPGTMALKNDLWLQIDEAYSAQVKHKLQLLETHPEIVQADPSAGDAAEELLDLVLAELDTRDDFEVAGAEVTCPDGRCVCVDRNRPFHSLAALVQEDFCILEKRGVEHMLIAALLGFPASWTLSEKFMRPLVTIHEPVTPYTEDIARRVERLFDGVKPGHPIWRANALFYEDPELHQPRRLDEDRGKPEGPVFIRSERQTILRLPISGAVVFSIHTTVIPEAALTEEQAVGLKSHPIQNEVTV